MRGDLGLDIGYTLNRVSFKSHLVRLAHLAFEVCVQGVGFRV
jgi:hypothetical protein